MLETFNVNGCREKGKDLGLQENKEFLCLRHW